MTELIPDDDDHSSPDTNARPQSQQSNSATNTTKVDILILGAGWLSQYLLPLLGSESISYAATSTTGRAGTLKFKFDQDDSSLEQYRALPSATILLITFPLAVSSRAARKAAVATGGTNTGVATLSETVAEPLSESAAHHLLSSYRSTHPSHPTHPILYGSTGEWTAPIFHDRHSVPTAPFSPRWLSEQSFLELGGMVLHLAGLFSNTPSRDRLRRIWELAVPKTKEGVKGKGGVSFVDGVDVGRGVVGVFRKITGSEGEGLWEKNGKGQRWILTDGRCYDWWGLIWENARELDRRFCKEGTEGAEADKKESAQSTYRKWLLECMREENVRALPRDGDRLGRRMDSRAFWETWDVLPLEKGFGWPSGDK